jgi:hypothetical protein
MLFTIRIWILILLYLYIMLALTVITKGLLACYRFV